MKTLVVSAFPGCGKTYYYNNCKDKKVLDSDSSEFSWVKDDNGNNTKERNPNFPKNYMKHIKENIGKVDIIFVSSHREVRDALIDSGIEYFNVLPMVTEKSEWIRRFEERGNNKGFIDFISSNWSNFIYDILSDKGNTICLPFNNSYYIDENLIICMEKYLERKNLG